MSVIQTWFSQDLQKAVKVNHIDGNLFSHNGNGNSIGVRVYNDGEPVTLTGTVSGYVITSDGSTVPCVGARSGNEATITIPPAAYQPGNAFITIFLTDGSTVTTLCAAQTTVLQARTGSQVSPGSVVTDWTQTINAAMQSVENAAENLGGIIATPYASLTYPVPLGKYTYYNNGLYRCISPIETSEEFTAAHWTQVKLGDDVSDLKSALNESDAKLIVEPFNLNDFISNSSNYLSYDSASEIITVTAIDTRNENLLYKFLLIKGVEYAVVIDNNDGLCKFQIYDPQNSVMAYNQYTPYHSWGHELTFIPSATGYYTLKILRDRYPFTITNLHIVNYKLWKEKNDFGVKPVFKVNVNPADSINSAIFSASRHGFTSVLVPAGNYTIDKSIVMRSNITLKSENGTNYLLADQTNDFMVTNAGITVSSVHTDTNICIDGGIWDGNRSNQDRWVLDGDTKIKLVVAFWLGGVNGITIKNCKIVNSKTYGILISNSNDVDIDNVVVNVGDVNNPSNGDGIHVLGPADNVKIHNCTLHSEDNVVAINADDVDHGIYTTTGDISNVEISDNYIKNTDGGQGMLVLSATHPVRNISIHDIKGTAGYIVNFSCFNIVPGAGGRYTNISVKNIQMDIYGDWQHAIGLYGIIRDINIENIQIRNITTTGSNRFQILRVSKLGTCPSNVRFLNVSDIIFGENVTDNCLLYGVHVEAGCSIENANFSKIQGKQTIAQRSSVYPFVINGSIDTLSIDRLMFSKALNIIVLDDANSSIRELCISGIAYNVFVVPRIYNPNDKRINIMTISDCIDFEATNADNINFQRQLYAETVPINHFWYKAGEIVRSTNPNTIGYRCLTDGSPFNGNWQANRKYQLGGLAKIGDYICVCASSGTSGSDVPTVRENASFVDGTVWWTVYHKGVASFVSIPS